MANTVQQIQLGSEPSALEQGRSAHGRWRVAFQRAAPPEAIEPVTAALAVIQDSDRLAFALAEGPAASFLADRLAAHLWTLESAGPDWPVDLRSWLAETDRWQDAPQGLTGFIAGRLERAVAGGRVYLAWLGLNSVQLLERGGTPLQLDLALGDDEGWSSEHGPEPVGMGLHAYRGSLFGLDRLLVYSSGAAPFGADLPDLPVAELQRALEDWSGESNRDLALFDLRLTPVISQPSSVLLNYRWVSPELCLLSWHPAPNVTGSRIEEAETPAFDAPTLVAELTDGRQVQYTLSPPSGSARYYRVVPLNQGVSGTPSEPVRPTPVVLATPRLAPVGWSEEGGYVLRWTPIVQATGYEVQASDQNDFDERHSEIVYRGAAADLHLPTSTPPARFYRVRAINVLYAPNTPSAWSQAVRAPIQLDTPVFTRVTQQRLEWTSVPGARSYAVHVTPKGLDEGQGEDSFTVMPACGVADQYATYRVRAFRQPEDRRTASEWSDPVTIAPPQSDEQASGSASRLTLPVLIGAAGVALVVGLMLGLIGLRAYQDLNATSTRTPIPGALVQATYDSATQSAAYATAIAVTAQFVNGQTVVASRWTKTPTATATFTPSNTPNLTETVDAAFSAGLTATAAQWTATPTVTLTPSLTITPTPTITPNLTDTIEAVMAAHLTATAARWTATPTVTLTPSLTITPTPTITPNLTDTIEAVMVAHLTATAAQWTATPTVTLTPLPTATLMPSTTPNMTQTLIAAFAVHLSATAAQWTATPTVTLTPSPTVTLTPSSTPNVDATIAAMMAAHLTSTAAQWTATPTSTATLTPSATPNVTETLDALFTARLTSGCIIIRLPDGPLPVMSGPYAGDRLLLSSLPHLAEVTGRQVQPGDPPEVWLRVRVTTAAGLLDGWVRLPPDVNEQGLYTGPDCPVEG